MTNEKKQKSKITEEDMAKILDALAKAYEKAGKKLETAVKLEGDQEPELLIDNRDKDKLN